MSTTLVKISVFAIAAFLVAGFVFADLGQSASANPHQKNVNSGNNHQKNSCTDDCNSLTIKITKTTKVQAEVPATDITLLNLYFFCNLLKF